MTQTTKYTIDDLKKAVEEWQRWEDKFANSSSNNPNKFRGQINSARAKADMIERELKVAGILKVSEEERLNKELDRLYPNARSKTIITYQEKKYQIRYFPLRRSRSRKTVTEWGHSWCPVEGE